MFDGSNNDFYAVDNAKNVVRYVDPSAGLVMSAAGQGGVAGGSGSNGNANGWDIGQLGKAAVDSSGNVLAVFAGIVKSFRSSCQSGLLACGTKSACPSTTPELSLYSTSTFGDAHNFSGADAQVNAMDPTFPATKITHLKDWRARGNGYFWKYRRQFAPHHHANEVGALHVCHLPGAHKSSVAQCGHAVGYLRQFFQAVRYVNDAHALGP